MVGESIQFLFIMDNNETLSDQNYLAGSRKLVIKNNFGQRAFHYYPLCLILAAHHPFSQFLFSYDLYFYLATTCESSLSE